MTELSPGYSTNLGLDYGAIEGPDQCWESMPGEEVSKFEIALFAWLQILMGTFLQVYVNPAYTHSFAGQSYTRRGYKGYLQKGSFVKCQPSA